MALKISQGYNFFVEILTKLEIVSKIFLSLKIFVACKLGLKNSLRVKFFNNTFSKLKFCFTIFFENF